MTDKTSAYDNELCALLSESPIGREAVERIRELLAALNEQSLKLHTVEKDAARYRWLRDGNGYAPEEEMIRGGIELDELCDEGIAERYKALKP